MYAEAKRGTFAKLSYRKLLKNYLNFFFDHCQEITLQKLLDNTFALL